MNWSDEEFGFETRAIHAGQETDPGTGAIITPLYLTSTYAHSSPGVHKGFEYSRSHNPTRKAYEACVANLEGARFGFAFASGCIGATTAVAMLEQGDHVVCCDDMYGGTYRLFEQVFRKQGIDFCYVDLTGANMLEAAMKPNTRMVWLESPTNPLMKLLDIAALASVAHDRGVMVMVDNTFMSPFYQRPIELGADMVLHSTTKYINGHSDLIGGLVVTDDEEIANQLGFLSNTMGGIQSTFDAFLCLRSLKTLAIRMRAHERNAFSVARFLEGHDKVANVLYPGLESHPQYALAKAQMSGFGGMIAFTIKGGLPAARRMLETVNVFTLAESLGGVESLIEHPAIMTHSSLPEEKRLSLGIDDGLIRLSVGIESEADLLRDLDQALAAA
ncbi:MAG: PLP-dependent transferase [Gammaproteobacteria bacterium]|nr:MAG: PLP-dependent transferase [Gammaproteobacteria bacterium]TDJ35994.1 MAG: PLP-dependent transferase [Gammaproteobacteria bacterium]